MSVFRFFPIFLLLAATACEDTSLSPVDPVNPQDVTAVAEMNQQLAWKLFKAEQQQKPGENVLISPFSIHTALFMAANGAQGSTQQEMLEFMEPGTAALENLNALHKDLTVLLTEQNGAADVKVANAFFYDPQRMSVKAPFRSILQNSYNAPDIQQNFSNPDAALDYINGWVKNNTQQKIDQILQQITQYDVAFLINALHFKADWATGFAPQLTQQGPFTRPDGTSDMVNFVTADRNFNFKTTPLYELVDIPFKDSTFSLSFIQPSPANTQPDWSLQLDAAVWEGLYDDISYDRAIVYFPRLKLAYDNDLINSLKQLGVQKAFSESGADFSPMGTGSTGNIYISQIRHKAVLEVDEKGAEGAAVTSIGFAQTSLPPVFRFDEPFVLVLRHVPTNTIVFVGKVFFAE